MADDEGHSAWDGPGYAADWGYAPAHIYLTVRDDPNTGLTPEGEGYRDPFDLPVWDRLAEHGDHLGGSLVVGDGIPEPMTPWFLQVQRVAEYADYGNGELHIYWSASKTLHVYATAIGYTAEDAIALLTKLG